MSNPYFPVRQVGWRQRIVAAVLCALAGTLVVTLTAPAAADAAKRKRGVPVKFMTRNLFLGSGLSAGLGAGSVDELCDGAGTILHEVDQTQPAKRMAAAAKEILAKKPDLVGLQEAAAWYTQSPGDGRPPEVLGGSGTFATTVRYDFLQLILSKLNKGQKRYKVAAVQNEFEFESETNLDGLPTDSPNASASDCTDAEVDGRMLIRDAILARVKAGVHTTKVKSESYDHSLQLPLAGGFPFDVHRGWEALDARVRGSRKFRFVNTHLEAFDNDVTNTMVVRSTGATSSVGNGDIREAQASELVGPGGPMKSALPVVSLGDFNSNVPGVKPGDEQAFQVVLGAGFKRRSTEKPPSCCVDELFTASLADFDHIVDHIVANRKSVKRLSSSVIGRALIGGIRPSDHAGVFSVLRLPR